MERDYNEQQQAAGAGQGGAHGNVSVFFAPSYTKKPESLPRQARDNTGTAEKKEYFSAGAGGGGEDADPDDVSSESDEESDLPSKLSRGWCVALSQRTAVGTESKPRSLLHVWAYYVATCCVGCVRVRVRVNALWMRCGQATVVDRRHGREAMDDSAWARLFLLWICKHTRCFAFPYKTKV